MPVGITEPIERVMPIDTEYYRLVEHVKQSKMLYFEHSEELKRLHALGWEVAEKRKREQMGYVTFWLNSWAKWYDLLSEHIQKRGY